MSNLLKSKFLLGVMIVAVMFVGFAAVSNTADAQQPVVSASDIQYAATVQSGSSGQASLIWQKFLNGYSSANLVADGQFGPLSSASLKIWQASRSLGADGVAGPMSRASAVAQINSGVTMPVGGTFPAGCSSASGFSTTLANTPCSGGSNLPAGCMPGYLFSPATGMSCSGGSTPTTGGALEGGAGDITLSALSTESGEEVGEGDEDVKIMSFEVEADDGSDVEISSVKVEFFQDETADSDSLDDYASSVSIWMDGEMVGEADVEDFSESSDYWSKSISLSNAIVRAGDTADFTVAITALNNLDSGDINSDDWSVDLLSVRFEDAEGVVTTESGSPSGADGSGAFEKNFDFASFATANSVELKVTLNDDEEDINEAHVIDIDDTDMTDDVEILAFTIEADGDSDLMITEIPATITTSVGDESTIIANAQLWFGGESIASDTIAAGGAVVFEDLDITVDAGDTAEFTITVDVEDTGDAELANADTIQASLTTVNVDAIEAEDESGEEIADADASGSAVGDAHSVFDAGIMVEFVSATAERTFTADAAGESDQGEYVITFDVTSFDGVAYLDRHLDDQDTIGDAGEGVEYDVTSSAGTPVASSEVLESPTSDTNDTADVFQVEEDDTRRFTATVILTADAATDGSHLVFLQSIGWGTVVTDATNDNNYTFNLGDFKTPSLFLNDM